MHQHVTRLFAVACVAAVIGCGGTSPHASVTCGPPECPADATLLLVAEVDPPSDSELVRQEFGAVTIDPQTGLFALALDTQVTLTGTVSVGDGTATKGVAATVVATRPSRITGRPDVVYQAAVNPIDGTYTLVVSRSLNDGEKYALRVATTDASLVPPQTLSVLADADKGVDVAFASPLKLPELHGTLVDSLQQPLAGVQIQATTTPAASGATVVVSTTTTTDDKGAFSIRLVPSPPGKVLLTATPTAMAATLLPSLTLPVDTTKLGATNSLTANLKVPPLPASVQVAYNVTGFGTSGANMAVPSASCVFTADVSDPNATDGTQAIFRATSMSDANGLVTIDLIPNSGNRSYTVTVTPDPTQPFATKMATVSVGPPGYGPNIQLSLRSQLSGLVLNPLGKPLRNLMVVPAAATVAAAVGASPLAATTTPDQATVGADGTFSLRLDPGSWDVGLVPPADSLLPRLWLTQLDLSSDLDIGTVLYPQGVMVHGVVHDPTGAPLAHANVRIYTVTSGNSACAPNDQACLAPPRLRAESSSASDGVVSLILPSQPKD